jgi:hypothetical protein
MGKIKEKERISLENGKISPFLLSIFISLSPALIACRGGAG